MARSLLLLDSDDPLFVTEQVRGLYQGQARVIVANFAISALFAGGFFFYAPMRSLIWVLLLGLVLAARIYNIRQFERCSNAHQLAGGAELGMPEAKSWLWRSRIGVLLTGLLWGASGPLLVDFSDPLRLSFAILALGGMSAGSVNALASDRWSGLAFLIATPTPLLLVLLASKVTFSIAIALLFLVGIYFVASISRTTTDGNHELIRLRLNSESMNKALRESEERWKFALEGAQQAVFDWQPESGPEYYSERWLSILGFAPENLPTSWQPQIHPDDQKFLQQARNALIEGRSDLLDVEYRCRHNQDYWVWIHERGKAMSSISKDLPLRVVGTREDITEYRLLQEQAQHSDKIRTIGQLAGGVAHDFNNNLTAMSISIDLLNFDQSLSSESRKCVEELEQMVERATNTTRQLLMFGRRSEILSRPLELSTRLSQLAEMLQKLLGEKIQLSVVIGTEPLYSNLDPTSLDQAIINLTLNARDAMPSGGAAELSLQHVVIDAALIRRFPHGREGDFSRISLKDNGSGMDVATQQRIFEPFFTTKEVDKGTGLGLASVYGMVAQRHGFIDVQSALEEGTTISLFFPMTPKDEWPHAATSLKPDASTLIRKEENSFVKGASTPKSSTFTVPLAEGARPFSEAPVSSGPGAPSAPPTEAQFAGRPNAALSETHKRGSGLRLMVVDDEPAVRESLNRMLKFLGHDLELFADGVQALAAWARSPDFDLVLTDLVMPGSVSGIDLASHIRAQRPNFPILLMSGYGPERLDVDLQAAIRQPGLQFLAKPFRVEELRTILANFETTRAGDH